MSLLGRALSRWIPSPLAARALRDSQEALLWEIHRAVPPPAEGEPDAIATAMEQLGETLGAQLRDQLKLPPTRQGAARAWRITSRLAGLRFDVREQPGTTFFDHRRCPLWERFRSENEVACPRFCETVARGVARAVAPGCRMEVTRAASLDHPCAKALHDA